MARVELTSAGELIALSVVPTVVSTVVSTMGEPQTVRPSFDWNELFTERVRAVDYFARVVRAAVIDNN
jgi:hypothetical protein